MPATFEVGFGGGAPFGGAGVGSGLGSTLGSGFGSADWGSVRSGAVGDAAGLASSTGVAPDCAGVHAGARSRATRMGRAAVIAARPFCQSGAPAGGPLNEGHPREGRGATYCPATCTPSKTSVGVRMAEYG